MGSALINNRYEVVRALGRGGMSHVLLVRDRERDGKLLALKSFSVARHVQESVAHFKREFVTLAKLRHPNLAEVYDFGVMDETPLPASRAMGTLREGAAAEGIPARDLSPHRRPPSPPSPLPGGEGGEEGRGPHGSTFFFTTEYVEGEDLLAATRGMGWDDLWDVVVQICRGLDYIHARGLIHSDIKPSNILISRPAGAQDAAGAPLKGVDRVRLIDFGLVGEASRQADEIKGTVGYIAPEVAVHGAVDRRADLYSLGCTLYHVVAGRTPFEGRTTVDVIRQHVEARPAPPSELRADCPAPLDELILRLLAKRPEDRFEGADAVIRFINRRTGAAHAVETTATREGYARSGRFVGRDRELSLLVDAFARTFPDRAREAGEDLTGGLPPLPPPDRDPPILILVAGEGGIGKSRLVREFKTRAQLARVDCLLGRAYPDAAGPYAPWRDVVKSFSIARGSVEADRISTEIRDLIQAADRDEAADEKAAAAEREAHAAHAASLTPEEAKIRLFEGVTGLVLGVVGARPSVVVLEDIHWADDGSLELLQYVARTIHLARRREVASPEAPTAVRSPSEAAPPPILFIATCRDTDIEPSPGMKRFHTRAHAMRQEGYLAEVRLDRLDRAAVRDLVGSIVHVEAGGEALGDRIYDETRGNPFFVEELMRSLLEEGVLLHRGGAWHLEVEDLSRLKLPSSVEDVLVERTRRLGGPDLDAIGALAVYRRPITAEEFATLAVCDPTEARRRFHSLVLKQILYAEPAAPGVPPRYAFIHDLARQAVYVRMSADERTRRHGQVAEALLQKGKRTGRYESGELAHHLQAAGRYPEAARFAEAAAVEATGIHANRRAIEHFDAALKLLDLCEGTPPAISAAGEGAPHPDPSGTTKPAFAGSVPVATANAPPVGAPLSRGERGALLGSRLSVLERRSDALARVGDAADAIAGYEEILQHSDDLLGPGKRAYLHRRIGQVHALQGHLDDAIEALALALRTLGVKLRSLEGVRILNETGTVYVRKGLYDKAIDFCQSGLELLAGLDVDGTNDQAALWNTLGVARAAKGEYKAATEQFEKALAIRRGRNDLAAVAESTNCLGRVLADTEQPDLAIHCFREAQEIKERMGDTHGIADAAASLGAAYHALGQTALALEHHERSLRIRERIGDLAGAVASRNRIAEVHLACAAYEPALDELSRALAAARSPEAEAEGREAALTLVHLARALTTLGDHDQAASHGADALDMTVRRGMRREQAACETALASLALSLGDEDRAERHLSQAVTIYEGMEDRTGLARSLLDLVDLYRRRGDKELAERVFKKVAALAAGLAGRSLKARVLLAKAWLDLDLSPPEAERDLAEALGIAEAMRRPELIWRIHHAAGRARQAAQDPEGAAAAYVRAMESIRQIWSRLPERYRKGYLEEPERREVRIDFCRAREAVLARESGD